MSLLLDRAALVRRDLIGILSRALTERAHSKQLVAEIYAAIDDRLLEEFEEIIRELSLWSQNMRSNAAVPRVPSLAVIIKHESRKS